MKLNRRQFLASLMAIGATLALPVPLAQATTVQVNAAWKQLLKDPWFFEVNEYNTIVDPSMGEPEFRRDVFDVHLGHSVTPESLIEGVDSCYPLTYHFERLATDELEVVQSSLEDDDTLSFLGRRRLKRLAKALGDEGEGWADWVLLEGAAGLPRFEREVEDWLASPIDGNDIEWLPARSGAQGQAMAFFESLPVETLAALGVVIIEGECPGSSYFAAELRQDIDDANVVAADMGMPFRFRKEYAS